jgi:FAD/FMN-containing dehydrogenase
MATTSRRQDALAEALRTAGFQGEVAGRAHPAYDALRTVFNGMVDRRPALIARCTDAQDVSAALGFARERGLPVSVYGGGHNVTGNAVCEDGVTLDLRPRRGSRSIPPRAPAAPRPGSRRASSTRRRRRMASP